MDNTRQSIAFPEVGQIRKGTPKIKHEGKFIQGSDLKSFFRVAFFPGADEAKAIYKELHPDLFTKYDLTYRRPGEYAEPDGFETPKLRALIPFRSVFDGWEWFNEAYSAGTLIAKADDNHIISQKNPLNTREYLIYKGEPFKEFKHGDVITYSRGGRDFTLPFRTSCRLRLFLPELGRLVTFVLKSTSFYDRLNIDAQLGGIQFLADTLNRGNAGGIPLIVYRREQDVSWNKPDGTAARVKKWLINIEADPDWVKAAVARLGNFALTGEIINQALLPLGSAEPAGVYDPDFEPDEDGSPIDGHIVEDENHSDSSDYEPPFPPAPAPGGGPGSPETAMMPAPDEPGGNIAENVEPVPERDPIAGNGDPAAGPGNIAENSDLSSGDAELDRLKRPYSGEILKARVNKFADDFRKKGFTATPNQRSITAILLEIALSDLLKPAECRKKVQFYLFGKDSLADHDDAEILAYLKWLAPIKDKGGAYTPGPFVTAEAHSALEQFKRDQLPERKQ
jgi:hypothetical protein